MHDSKHLSPIFVILSDITTSSNWSLIETHGIPSVEKEGISPVPTIVSFFNLKQSVNELFPIKLTEIGIIIFSKYYEW